ncbi:MAG: winged helix-turn-helix domain-containing protein [Acidobacteriota bacterium]
MEDSPQADRFVLTELDQLKALSDPLRARILTELCKAELTTKQVAESLGEKPTRLYHHVESLERAGLIRLTHTRQNRGTLEKYFRSVARRFEVGGALLGGGSDDALTTMIDTLLDQTRNECHRLASGEEPLEQLLDKEVGLLSFVELHADQKTIDRLTRRLRRLVEDLTAEAERGEGEDERRYRLLLAYYPLDRFPDE